MSEIILKTGSWQTNAGLCGFIQVLDYGDIPYELNETSLIIDSQSLSSLSQTYWDYWFSRSKQQIQEYRLFNQIIPSLLDEAINQPIDEEKENQWTKYISDFNNSLNDKIIKKEKDTNSSSTALGNTLAHVPINIHFDKLKELYKITNNKKETPLNKIIAIQTNKKLFTEMLSNEFIYYLTINKLKMIELNRIIPQGAGIAQKGFKDNLITGFQEYINNAIELYTQPQKNQNKKCIRCNTHLSNNQQQSILAAKFENNNKDKRKLSLTWNNNSVQGNVQCSICQLIEYMLPFGLNIVYGNGLFINDSSSIRQLIETNQLLKQEIFTQKIGQEINYKQVIKTLFNEQKKINYDQADIQVIRCTNIDNLFPIQTLLLTKSALQFMNNNQKTINALSNAYFIQLNEKHYIIDDVLMNITNHQSFDHLIIKMLHASKPQYVDNHKYYTWISQLIYLNKKQKEHITMSTQSDTIDLTEITTHGQLLRKHLYAKGYDNKITGITHRLLSAVRSQNYSRFMDILLHTYLSVNLTVPIELSLLNKDNFKNPAYSFLTGLMSNPFNAKNQTKQEETN